MSLKSIFPYSYKVENLLGLAVTVIVYIAISAILGWICSIFSGVFLIGIIASIISWVVSAYCFVGIVIAFLVFFKVLK